MKQKKAFDIAGMARLIMKSENSIKLSLGIPPVNKCKALTISAASDQFLTSETDSDSELAACYVIDKLSLEKVEKAEKFDDFEQVKFFSKADLKSFEIALIKEYSLCSTLEEIGHRSFWVTPYSLAHTAYLKRKMELSEELHQLKELFESCPPETQIQLDVCNKWNVVSQAKIDEIKDVYEMEDIFLFLCSKSLLIAMNKGLSVCKNSAEVQHLHQFLFIKQKQLIFCAETFVTKLLEKWLNLSSSELANAKSFEDHFAVMCCAAVNSKIQIEAANICLDIVGGFTPLEALFINAPRVQELKIAIFDKWLDWVYSVAEAKRMHDYFNNNELTDYSILSRIEIMAAIYKKIATFYGYKEKAKK